MDHHNCERCGYTTNRFSNLKIHLLRETPCDDRLESGMTPEQILDKFDALRNDYEYICNGCEKKFKQYKTMWRHRKNCTVYSMKQEMKELRSLVTSGAAGSTVVTNSNNTTNNTTTNNVIIINKFGSEDISHVVNDKEFIAMCLQKLSTTGIVDIVDKIYLNPEAPHNQTVKIKSSKQDHVVTHEGGGQWKIRSSNDVVPTMVRKGNGVLFDYYNSEAAEPVRDRDIENGMPKHAFMTEINTSAPCAQKFRGVAKSVKALIANKRP